MKKVAYYRKEPKGFSSTFARIETWFNAGLEPTCTLAFQARVTPDLDICGNLWAGSILLES